MYQLDIYKYQSKKFNSLIALFFEKSFCSNESVMVFCENEKQMKLIDKLLWEYNPSSWIPHLTTDDIYAEKSKIILSNNVNTVINNPKILCIIDSNITDYINTGNIERIAYFIPNDKNGYDTSISLLKEHSKTVNMYIQQQSGKWEKQS